MHLAGSPESWHWSEDVDVAVSFCIHTLVVDGLRVAPFDRHRDGDGSLRALGLDEATWRGWVNAVLTGHDAMRSAGGLAAEGRMDEAREIVERSSFVLRHPAAACPGSAALRERLTNVWQTFEPAAQTWRREMTLPMGDQARMGDAAEQRRRWAAVSAYRDRLPTLSVYVVNYPSPAVMAIPPMTALIAPAPDAPGYTRQLVEAADLLSR